MKRSELLPTGGIRKEPTPDRLKGQGVGPPEQYTETGQTVIGHSSITVYYDNTQGTDLQNFASQFFHANVVVGPYSDMERFFGIPGDSVNVYIVALGGANNGMGGASHSACDFVSGGDLYLDATFACRPPDKPLDLEVALYVAELSECFMGPQGAGWDCSSSNGEGLSRFCAEQETPVGTLHHFATGPAWARAGFPDWVNTTEPTDGNDVSTGCAVVYLYWMRSLGFTNPQIVQAGGATLSANYQKLTGKTTAYQDLLAALKGKSVTSDNPFFVRPIPINIPPGQQRF